jgi:plastocyanin
MRGARPARRGIRRHAAAALLALALGAAAAGPAAAAAADEVAPADTGSVVGARAVPPGATAPQAAPSAAAPASDAPAARAQAHDVAAAAPPARAAASRGVRIVDFAFSPASVTASVGDTITWTNADAAPHTATADDGSFDTGTLDRGASGSHTFTAAGTFAYVCAIHPSMRGTVTVSDDAAPAPADPPDASPAPGSAAPATPAATPAPAATLPDTGLDARAVALIGVVLLLLGLPLRSSTKPR